MNAHKTQTIISPDGTLQLDVPFAPGAVVDVIVIEATATPPDSAPTFPLRGTKAEYREPFEPVGVE